MFQTLKQAVSASRAVLLATLILSAPLSEAGTIRVPEKIRIDIHWAPEQINFDFEVNLDDGDASTSDEVLYTGLYFRTHITNGDTPWLEGGYGELFPDDTAHDLNDTLRKFLFEKKYGDQDYDFMRRVSLSDTYLFAFESYVDYVPKGCEPFTGECPPALSATYGGETLITFYDSKNGPRVPGPEAPTAVGLPGPLSLAMIAALGVYVRSRSA
ncbi:MAG: hypothetical protein CME36_01975 [unclassified Hahellaceae]|nr:hypothetical protein [Hahellaceae bacterium]|tara:strand:- start:26860 stop:27498 length:639 start_codon:yes stop_codon:yes gene_type:complete